MSAVEFQINLSGNLASALGQAGNALHKSGDDAKHAKEEFEGFEGELGKLSGSLGGLSLNFSALSKGGSLFTFDLAEGIKAAYEVVEGLVDKFVELGKEMVGVAAKTQDLNLAIRLNVGDEKAKQVDELAESFERTTRFDASDIKRALLPLLKQGISDKDTLDTIATIGTDLAARNAGGIEDVQQSIAAFAGIFQRGRLKPQMLAQFGIQANDYFDQLGKMLGVSSESAAKMAKQGKVNQDKLASLAASMIAARQGGSIGEPSLRSEKTLGGTLEHLRNVGENLFEQIAEGPGMKAIQNNLDALVNTLKGPEGKALMDQIDGLLTSLGKLITPENISAFVGLLTDGFHDVVEAAKELIDLLGKAKPIAEAISAPMASLMDFGDKLLGRGGQGGGGEQPSGGGELQQLTAALTSGQITSDQALEIAKKHHLGPFAGIPAFADGAIVTGPTVALIGEAGPEAVVPLSDSSMTSLAARGGSGGDSGSRIVYVGGIDVDVHVGDGANGQEAGLIAAQTARVELKKMLDEIGWAVGATVVE